MSSVLDRYSLGSSAHLSSLQPPSPLMKSLDFREAERFAHQHTVKAWWNGEVSKLALSLCILVLPLTASGFY